MRRHTDMLPERPTDHAALASERRTRFGLAAAVCVLATVAFLMSEVIPERLRAVMGVAALLCLAAACSARLQAVNWRTVGWGFTLQVSLALAVLKLEVGGVRPVYELFAAAARVVAQFLAFTNAGATFVFGVLADPEAMGKVFPSGFVFAFSALPAIVFVSAVFTVLFHLGLIQIAVRAMARVMMRAMGTSGAETLAASANVFMGMTEAPLIIKPYIAAMTRSELLALMAGGLATVSGGMLVVYIGVGADPVAALATSVMAAPAGLYLAKILWPECEEPVTRGTVRVAPERPHVNVIDAAAAGASDGMVLALNVAAMLIAFLAIIAMVDAGLALVSPGLSLAGILSYGFAPLAALLGVPAAEIPMVADLLGTKLVANEMVAFVKMTSTYRDALSERSLVLATFALNGFANLGSIGVILGGIGGLVPERRRDLAELSSRALLAGFVATLLNAALAGVLL
jgi:CNT family concentrative nucleoside transporter